MELDNARKQMEFLTRQVGISVVSSLDALKIE